MARYCANPLNTHWSIRWIYRLLGLLFLYTSLTLFPSASLVDTPLVQTLRAAYPTWWHVLYDIGITMLVLGVIALGLKLFILFARKHHFSKRIIMLLRKWNSRFIRNFLSFDFFATRWLLGTLLALGLWYGVAAPLAARQPDIFHVPHYSSQPVIMCMGVFGLLLLIESIDFWQMRMQRYFCMKIHL